MSAATPIIPSNGRKLEVTAAVASNLPKYRVGERLKVLYRPNNPAEVMIDTFIERWLFPTIFGGIGLVLGLVGWGALLLKLVSHFTPKSFDDAERFTIE